MSPQDDLVVSWRQDAAVAQRMGVSAPQKRQAFAMAMGTTGSHVASNAGHTVLLNNNVTTLCPHRGRPPGL